MQRTPLTLGLPAIAMISLVALAACGQQPAEPAPADAPVVAAVVTTPTAPPEEAQPAPDPAPAAEDPPPAVSPGTLTGALTYPSEGIPPLNVYVQRTDGSAQYVVATVANQTSYSVELPPGDYRVFAYPADNATLGGAHTVASPCYATPPGSADCDNHALVSVTVVAGQTAAGIDVNDWYGPPGFVPQPAGLEGSGVDVSDDPGVISGQIRYPSEGNPALDVYAVRVDGQLYEFVKTNQNQDSYAVQVAPGTYRIVAYWNAGGAAPTVAGAYTVHGACIADNDYDYSACDFIDLTLVEVTVEPGATVTGVDLVDWDEPSKFPPKP